MSSFTKPLVLAGAGVLLAVSSEASNWQVDFTGTSRPCFQAGSCATPQDPADKVLTDWVKSEMGEIETWLNSYGFGFPALPENPPIVRVRGAGTLARECGSFQSSPVGCYSSGLLGLALNFDHTFKKLTPQTRKLVAIEDPDFLYSTADTLAHEYFHAIQNGSNIFIDGKSGSDDWHVEGIATAVGYMWSDKEYGRIDYFPLGNYSEPLHKPSNPYTRSWFFVRLATMISGRWEPTEFANLYQTSPQPGADGVAWLDSYLKKNSGGLRGIYGRYVARYADGPEDFGAALPAPIVKTPVLPNAPVATHSVPFSVAEVAGVYSDATPDFQGNWDQFNPNERIYAMILENDAEERPNDMDLVVRDSVYRNKDRHVEAIYAAPGELEIPMNARPINVADDADQSNPQNFELRLRVGQITIEAPSCVSGGQDTRLVVSGPLTPDELIREFGGRVTVSAGSISPSFVFTAPSAPAKVDINIVVPTLSGGLEDVLLASVDVQEDCMIQMSGPGVSITWVASGDYSELLATGGGQAMYMKDGDVALFESGWMPIPAQARNMMVGAISGRLGGLAKTAKQVSPFKVPNLPVIVGDPGHHTSSGVEAFQPHRMAKVLSQRFSWKNLRFAVQQGAAAVSSKEPCRDGKKECRRVTMSGANANILLDRQGRAHIVTMQGQEMKFAYGSFSVRRPPGW